MSSNRESVQFSLSSKKRVKGMQLDNKFSSNTTVNGGSEKKKSTEFNLKSLNKQIKPKCKTECKTECNTPNQQIQLVVEEINISDDNCCLVDCSKTDKCCKKNLDKKRIKKEKN